jgi:uncharacterized membrane protein HdeD (DUF308 family)
MSIPTPNSPGLLSIEGLEGLRKNWWLMLLFGIVLVLLGSFAIVASQIATLTTVIVFGWVLLIGSVFQMVEAFTTRRLGGFVLSILVSILYFVLGLFTIRHPGAAAAGLTLVVAAALMIGGALRIVISIADRFHNWAWVLLNGVITLVLGIMIYNRWPGDTEWVIGLFVGIEMIFCGWAWVMLSLAIRSSPRAPA